MEQLDSKNWHIEAADGVKPKQVLFATIGSLGDLHPCLALALELQRRGHTATIATTEYYRAKVEGLGVGFRAVRPDWDPTDPELIRLCDDLKRGPEILMRKMVLPHLKDTYSDLLNAAAGMDLMIAGELNFAAPLVAEKLGLRWVSATLSPASFLSAHDPSVLVNVPWLIHLRKAGWAAYRTVLNIGRYGTRHWWNPVRELRREQGLRPDCDPIFRDKFSPDLVLALFSRVLAKPQPDWPKQTIQPGFVWFEHPGKDAGPDPRLRDFLDSGDPPIVFTQGSTAVSNPGNFYEVSMEAAARLGRRAVLVGASSELGRGSPQLLVLRYAPYSQIFPYAAVNVHQGGSGTTGEALRAGRPQLIVPYGWDQPDNAVRVERLDAGIHLPRREYTVEAATAALARLLREPGFSERAMRVGAQVRAEDGLNSACNSIESLLRGD
jgi:UDP:flavonoid glycosyltransferase YjiC (YdhE family)